MEAAENNPISSQTPKPHVVMIPSPGIGHLIPMIELTNKLLAIQNNLTISILLPTVDAVPNKAQESALETLPKTAVSSIFLPPVSFHDLPPEALRPAAKISLAVTRSLDHIRQVLQSLASSAKVKLVGLIVDLFGTDAFDVATEFNVSSYVFFPCLVSGLGLVLSMPKMDQMVPGEFKDAEEPFLIPGFRVPLHGRDLPEPFLDRKNDAYKLFLHHSKRYGWAQGILINSFQEMEPLAMEVLQEGKDGGGWFYCPPPPVYAVGPLIKSGHLGFDEKHMDKQMKVLKWLKMQPRGSVLFVCFGSGGTLSLEQTTELALGLEMSQQRFIWVVKNPNEESPSGTYFSTNSESNPFHFLPKGFLERCSNGGQPGQGQALGMVVPDWAPQVEILSHESTGGFLTHCGWNSVLESIVHGVPMIAWPLYAEQRMNAVVMTQDLKIALRPEVGEDGIVVREEIAKVVENLMRGSDEESRLVRNKINELKIAAAKAPSADGSSSKSLNELVSKWKN